MDMKTGREELGRRREKALGMGGRDKIETQHKLGRLTARERVEKLLDPGSFWEFGSLAHSDVPGVEDKTAADGKVVGFGTIGGKTVAVISDDHTVLAGTEGRVAIRKADKVADLAIEKGCPIVSLGDGGGARFPDIMGSDNLLGRAASIGSFSASRRVPHVATIMGECFGAPTWEAARADFVVMVKGACMAVSGPRVLEVATSEKVTPEELGGWQVHAEVTGLVDVFAENDEHCLEIVREFLSYMPPSCDEEPPYVPTTDPPDRTADEVLKIVPDARNRSYDMYRLIKAIVDDGKYMALKPFYDQSLITCLARLDGRTVGIIANQPIYLSGAPGPGACEKATGFIVLCDSYNIPLVMLHDTPGFFVSKAAERRKMPGRIMVWAEALTLASVPRISIIIRKSYAMSNINMGAPRLGPDLCVAWPTADISFMEPGTAANVVFNRRIREAADPVAEREKLIQQMLTGSEPWPAAGKFHLDDVIDPVETRSYLVKSLRFLRRQNGAISKKRLQNWPTVI